MKMTPYEKKVHIVDALTRVGWGGISRHGLAKALGYKSATSIYQSVDDLISYGIIETTPASPVFGTMTYNLMLNPQIKLKLESPVFTPDMAVLGLYDMYQRYYYIDENGRFVTQEVE